MEPVTALVVLTAKYGVRTLVSAMGGDSELSGLAAELFGALAASEDRMAQRLDAIDSKLDEVLEQRYTVAIGSGLRTLVDATTAPDRTDRNAELNRAREIFRDAVASARTPLQNSIAERYLMICALALSRDDAARTALERMEAGAFAVVCDAGRVRMFSLLLAMDKVDSQKGFRLAGKRSILIRQEAAALVEASTEAGDLGMKMLHEAVILADQLGCGPRLPFRQIAPGSAHWLAGPPGAGAPDVRVGPLRVVWHKVQATVADGARTRIRVDVEVHARPELPIDLLVDLGGLRGADSWEPDPGPDIWTSPADDPLASNMRFGASTTKAAVVLRRGAASVRLSGWASSASTPPPRISLYLCPLVHVSAPPTA